MACDEEHKLKESILSKSYLNDDFLLSLTSDGSDTDSKVKNGHLMSEKTQRLLDDYERLKFESEHLKIENSKLKE